MRLLIYNCPFGSASPDLDSMNLRLFHNLPSPPLQSHWKPERQICANGRWVTHPSCLAALARLHPPFFTPPQSEQNCTPLQKLYSNGIKLVCECAQGDESATEKGILIFINRKQVTKLVLSECNVDNGDIV